MPIDGRTVQKGGRPTQQIPGSGVTYSPSSHLEIIPNKKYGWGIVIPGTNTSAPARGKGGLG